MDEREERARKRSQTWAGQIVRLGEGKGGLYTELSHAERLYALAQLNERAWLAAGRELPARTPRAEWPGEIFDCVRRG